MQDIPRYVVQEAHQIQKQQKEYAKTPKNIF